MPRQKLVVPKFASEAEEANWWDQHMNQVEELFLEGHEERNSATWSGGQADAPGQDFETFTM